MKNKISYFQKIYLQILNEQKSPTSFTPELLLNDIAKKCYWTKNSYFIYTFQDILTLCNDDFDNYKLFYKLINYQKDKFDYSIAIIYFTDFNKIDEIFNKIGYIHRENKYNFSMNKVCEQFKIYYSDNNHSANNFNSIDIAPELGCVIGLNRNNINTNRDLEKQLDHELNHYFEGLQVKFNNKEKIKLLNKPNKKIVDILSNYYGVDFNKKESLIDDIKYHLFHEDEFRSMSANVFHEILKYNQTHLNQLNRTKFINDIINCDYNSYPIYLQEMIIFCYICHELSINRWMILIQGINSALNINKNIFQKSYYKIKDILKQLIN